MDKYTACWLEVHTLWGNDMKDRACIAESIMQILADIKGECSPLINESLFGYQNDYTSRDVAYALLEIGHRFEIPIETLIKRLSYSGEEYTADSLINVVSAIIGAL